MSSDFLIKEAVREFTNQGSYISAKWDTEGDQTFCKVSVDGQRNILYQKKDICKIISDKVIAKLEMPISEDAYHKGEGVIHFNSLQNVTLRFTASYSYISKGHYTALFDDYWYEEGTFGDENYYIPSLSSLSEEKVMSDPLALYQKLHKASVTFLGRINSKLITECILDIKIKQGDDLILSDDIKQFYHQHIADILKEKYILLRKNEKPLLKNKKYYPFHSLILQGNFTARSMFNYTIRPSHEYFESFKDEVVVLIP